VLLVTGASFFVDWDRAGTEVITYFESHVPISGEMQRHVFDTIGRSPVPDSLRLPEPPVDLRRDQPPPHALNPTAQALTRALEAGFET
jgi:hypothetical protein